MNIELEWLNLACFRLWQDGRGYLVTDPGTPSVLGMVRGDEFYGLRVSTEKCTRRVE